MPPVVTPQVEEEFTGVYLTWLYGPLLELVCAGVTLYEYYTTESSPDSTVIWEVTGWWSIGTSVAILLWFH